MAREHLLLGIFQENTSDKVTEEKQYPQISKTNEAPSSTLYKESKERIDINFANKVEVKSKEAKLIRIFPGPAGLVAHTKSDNTSVVSYLNNVKESESKPVTEHTESNFSKSSQDEKNLLNEKAWMFLLDDLPKNFFDEYGISTIKSKANASRCNSMKVKFIAGILDFIDHSHDNPFIILKDSTGIIEGTVHRDIPLKYPGVLEPNVVILLHDVGLLKTTMHVVMNKYHILVSRINLLAVYSNKGRIIHTSHMEDILSSASNVELTKGNCITPISNYSDNTVGSCTTSSVSTSINRQVNLKSTLVNDSASLHRPNEHANRKEMSKKDSGNCEVSSKIFESFEYSMDIDDDLDNAFFTIGNEPVASDEHKCFNRSLSETAVARISEIQLCELQTQNANCLENASGRSVIESENKMKSESPVTKCNAENSKNLASYFTSGTFHDNEYDSDDEFLSQLDVDNAVNNSKRSN